MKDLIKIFTYCFGMTLLSFSLMGCEREEGCLDARATNFTPSADKNCCCEFPLLNLRLYHMAGTEEFVETTNYVDQAGTLFQLTNAPIYISQLHLVRTNGTEVGSSDSLALYLPDETTYVERNYNLTDFNQRLYGTGKLFTEGSFTKIRFYIGLDSLAHLNDPTKIESTSHPLSIQSDSMYINAAEGYRNSKMEVTYFQGTDTLQTTFSTSGFTNRILVELDYPVEVTKTFSVEVGIDIDYLKLFENVDLVNQDSLSLVNTLQSNLLDAFSVH